MVTGRCLCGGVQFEVHGELGETRLCYCELCRRANGSAFSANVPIPLERYRLLSGRELIREFEVVSWGFPRLLFHLRFACLWPHNP